jgi:Tol biopolymer transport system component
MPSVAELLERESTTVDLEPGDFERLLRRRDRKQRNQRLRAGALAIVLVLVTAAALARAFSPEDRTATPPTPTPTDMGSLGALAYGIDGDIYVADWDGTNPVRIADGRPGGVEGCGPSGYWAEGPIWSPNGRYLAYRGPVCDAIDTVWISDPEGNIVTSFPGEGWLISWSPDSSRVAAWVRWGKTIGVYGLDGVRQALLTLPPGLMASGDWDPVWSRDGASLFVPNGVEVPLDGRTPRRLPRDDPRSLRATYSPDGSRIAYHADGSLIVADADGSQARELISDWEQWSAWPHGVAWSPTGDRIAFTTRTFNGTTDMGDATELRVIDVASSAVTPLAGMGGTDTIWGVQFSPAGDRILFSRTEANGVTSLWTIRADGSDARRLVTGARWGDWQSLG